MPFTPINLFEGTLLPNTQTTLYTSPAQTRTLIKKFTVCNVTGLTQSFTINLVPKGGSVGNANLILTASLTSQLTLDVAPLMNHMLETGDFISMLAANANSLSIRASGAQIT